MALSHMPTAFLLVAVYARQEDPEDDKEYEPDHRPLLKVLLERLPKAFYNISLLISHHLVAHTESECDG